MIKTELKNVKSVSILIWNRLCHKDKWLTWSFIVSLVIILLSSFANLNSFLKYLGCCICFVCEGEPIYYTLAVSCLSGLFVYFVTVIIPEVRKSRAIYIEITQQLKKLEDDFIDLSLHFNIVNWCEKDNGIKMFVDIVKFYNRPNNAYYSLSFCKDPIEHLANRLDSLTANVLTYTPYLSQKELELLVDIRHRNITKRLIRKDALEANLLDEEEIYSYFQNLIQLNNDVIMLNQWIKSRTFRT